MNKIIMLLILLFMFSSCDSTIKKETVIKPFEIKINLSDNLDRQSQVYHIYFRNINFSDKSFGIDMFYPENNFKIKIFPGTYNIYCYGLVEKTATSQKVYSYNTARQVGIYNEKNINIEFRKLTPDFSISGNGNNYLLKILMADIDDIFSITSISVKQGTDKAKSVDYSFEAENLFYYSNISLTENGSWYMNISYDLKSNSDDDVLKKDNLNISTSRFEDVYLGNF